MRSPITTAASYREKKAYDLALADHDRAVALLPKDAVTINARGTTYLRKGDIRRAIADYDAAITLDPKAAWLVVDRAYAYRRLGDFDRSIADHGLAMTVDPKSPIAPAMRCWTRAMANRELDAAVADCEAAEKLGQAKSDTRESICFIRYRQGDYRKAISECDAALKAEPKLAYALYMRGLAKRRLGDTEEARADIAAAKAIDADVVSDFKGFGVSD